MTAHAPTLPDLIHGPARFDYAVLRPRLDVAKGVALEQAVNEADYWLSATGSCAFIVRSHLTKEQKLSLLETIKNSIT